MPNKLDHYQVAISIQITGVDTYDNPVGGNIASFALEKSLRVTSLTDIGFILEYVEDMPMKRPDFS